MFSVYQHWDPLKVCAVGRSYPPEFYSWIKDRRIRGVMETIAEETEEDYQAILSKLHSFGVETVRPNIAENPWIGDRWEEPPMNPRDVTVMIGNKFHESASFDWPNFYANIKAPHWPDYPTMEQFLAEAEQYQIKEAYDDHKLQHWIDIRDHVWQPVFDRVRQAGNQFVSYAGTREVPINGAQVSRVGRDLYFGTADNIDITDKLAQQKMQEMLHMFPEYRCHVINTEGHSDACYTPVVPGLIVTLQDIQLYEETFPGWETVYLPDQSWEAVMPFMQMKLLAGGRYWIPGFEKDQAVVDYIDAHIGHWLGYVEETVFDVNMLVVDRKNVIVFNENDKVFEAFERHGITPHVVPFRHRYFWDGGIHCITSDLHREGTMQDWFPDREG